MQIPWLRKSRSFSSFSRKEKKIHVQEEATTLATHATHENSCNELSDYKEPSASSRYMEPLPPLPALHHSEENSNLVPSQSSDRLPLNNRELSADLPPIPHPSSTTHEPQTPTSPKRPTLPEQESQSPPACLESPVASTSLYSSGFSSPETLRIATALRKGGLVFIGETSPPDRSVDQTPPNFNSSRQTIIKAPPTEQQQLSPKDSAPQECYQRVQTIGQAEVVSISSPPCSVVGSPKEDVDNRLCPCNSPNKASTPTLSIANPAETSCSMLHLPAAASHSLAKSRQNHNSRTQNQSIESSIIGKLEFGEKAGGLATNPRTKFDDSIWNSAPYLDGQLVRLKQVPGDEPSIVKLLAAHQLAGITAERQYTPTLPSSSSTSLDQDLHLSACEPIASSTPPAIEDQPLLLDVTTSSFATDVPVSSHASLAKVDISQSTLGFDFGPQSPSSNFHYPATQNRPYMMDHMASPGGRTLSRNSLRSMSSNSSAALSVMSSGPLDMSDSPASEYSSHFDSSNNSAKGDQDIEILAPLPMISKFMIPSVLDEQVLLKSTKAPKVEPGITAEEASIISKLQDKNPFLLMLLEKAQQTGSDMNNLVKGHQSSVHDNVLSQTTRPLSSYDYDAELDVVNCYLSE